MRLNKIQLLSFVLITGGCTFTSSVEKGATKTQFRKPSSQESLDPEQTLQKHFFALRLLFDFEKSPLSLVAALVEKIDGVSNDNSQILEFIRIESALVSRLGKAVSRGTWKVLPRLTSQDFKTIAALAKRAHDLVDPQIGTLGWVGHSQPTITERWLFDDRTKWILNDLDSKDDVNPPPSDNRFRFYMFAYSILEEMQGLAPALAHKFYELASSNDEKKADFEKTVFSELPRPKGELARWEGYFTPVTREFLAKFVKDDTDAYWNGIAAENAIDWFNKNANTENSGARQSFLGIEPLREYYLKATDMHRASQVEYHRDKGFLSHLSSVFFVRTQIGSLKLELAHPGAGKFIYDLVRSYSMIALINTQFEKVYDYYASRGWGKGQELQTIVFKTDTKNEIRNLHLQTLSGVIQNLWASLAQFHTQTEFAYTDLTKVYVDDISRLTREMLENPFLQKETKGLSVEHIASLHLSLAELSATQTLMTKRITMVGDQVAVLTENLAQFRKEVLAELAATESRLSQQVAAVSQQVTGVSGQVAGVSDQVAGVSGQVNSVAEQNKDLRQRVEEIQTQLGKQSQELQNRIAENQNKLDGLMTDYKVESEEQIQKIKSELADDRDKFKGFLNQQALEQQIALTEQLALVAKTLKETRDELNFGAQVVQDELTAGAQQVGDELRAGARDLKKESLDFVRRVETRVLEEEMGRQNDQYNRQMEEYLVTVREQESSEYIDFVENISACAQMESRALTQSQFDNCFSFLKNRISGKNSGIDYPLRAVSPLNISFETLKSPLRNLSFWSEMGESWASTAGAKTSGKWPRRAKKFDKYRDLPNPQVFVEATRALSKLLRSHPKFATQVDENGWNEVKNQIARFRDLSRELRSVNSAPILAALDELKTHEASFFEELNSVYNQNPKIELRDALKKLKISPRTLFGQNVGEISSLRAYAESYAACLGLASVTFPNSRFFDPMFSFYWSDNRRPGTDAWLLGPAKNFSDPTIRRLNGETTQALRSYVQAQISAQPEEEFVFGLNDVGQDVEVSRLVVEKFRTEKAKIGEALNFLKTSSKSFLANARKK